jgi:hypothetical protein
MRLRWIVFLGTAILAVATASVALAVSVHFVDGPDTTDNGLTLSSSGRIAGLGNFDTQALLLAAGDPKASCINPSGKTRPPGQNPVSVNLTGTQDIDASDINGNVDISVTTTAPASPVFGDPDFACPNKSWTEPITDVVFTSATLAIAQDQVDNGNDGTGAFAGTRYETVVISVSCTYVGGTANGALSCP